jgi:hypothetical protein
MWMIVSDTYDDFLEEIQVEELEVEEIHLSAQVPSNTQNSSHETSPQL